MATTNAQTFTIGGVTHQVEDVGARQLIADLQAALNAITSGDTTTAIKTFNEIIAFLDNIEDSSTLQGIIAGLNTSIAAKYTKPETGIPSTDLAQAVQTILNSVANKANSADVYPKSQTYNKDEVDNKVAISSGTYEQAVTRSQTDSSKFMWMLVDTIGSDTIRKPIFHVGNGVFVDMAGAVVEIGEVPNAPTFTMSDETSTPNEFPVGGGTVSINAGTDETIYYTTNGDTPTTSSTEYTEPIQVTEETTIKAIAVNRFGSSEVASETFTIAVDHKFQFTIKLTGNNSTEYVPISGSDGPKYNFTVDWGDGSETAYQNEGGADKTGVTKGCGHTYNKPDAVAGKEYTITLRGSKIPILRFGDEGSYNIDSLVSVEDNTLECETQFQADSYTRGGFYMCANLASLSANALQNNTWPIVSFQGTSLASVPDGLLGHLTKDGVSLTGVNSLFAVFTTTGVAPTATITESQMRELSAKIGAVTSFYGLFYKFKGTVHIPDDFFSNLVGANVTTIQNAFWVDTAGHAYGNKTAIYANLQPHLASGATETNWDVSITTPPSE